MGRAQLRQAERDAFFVAFAGFGAQTVEAYWKEKDTM